MPMETSNVMKYQQEILDIIRSGGSGAEIRDRLDDYHEKDIAEILPQLTTKEWLDLSTWLEISRLADIIEYVDDDAERYLEALPDETAAQILSAMEADDAVDFLKNTDSDRKDSWLAHMNVDRRTTLIRLAAFEEDTIGSHMTTNFVKVGIGMTIPQAMKTLVSQAADHDNISTIYVESAEGTYAGAFSLKDLIVARKTDSLADIVVPAYPSVYADEKIDDCLQVLEDYSEESIPVLSRNNRILGVITANDVVEVVDAQMSEDYAKLGGLTAEEDLNEPVSQSVRKRLPWLILLLGLGLLVSSVVSMYEHVVAKLTIIMAFQSMILDMSGNVGTQSLAVTIRVLMDENVTKKEKNKLIRKEMQTGLLDGLVLGAVAVAGVGIYIFASKGLPVRTALSVSVCIGVSLAVAMLISSLVGTVVPMFFKKIGVDPAVASGPLITTITDLVGVVTYYSLAWIMLVKILGM